MSSIVTLETNHLVALIAATIYAQLAYHTATQDKQERIAGAVRDAKMIMEEAGA